MENSGCQPLSPFSGFGAPAVAASPGSSPLPRPNTERNIHEVALSVHAKRLQLIASNMANADTPNYKATDIDFRDTLRQTLQVQEGKPLGTQAGSERRLSVNSSGAEQPLAIKYRAATQRSADGNTVDLDVERANFADATIRYQFELDRVSGYYKDMAKLLAETPY